MIELGFDIEDSIRVHICEWRLICIHLYVSHLEKGKDSHIQHIYVAPFKKSQILKLL